MVKLPEKIKSNYVAYFFLLLIITTSFFPMVGCISENTGIYQLFIAELPDKHVQFGYIGICSTIPGNDRVCKSTLENSPDELAKRLKVPITVIQQVLALQRSVSLVLPALSAILVFLGCIASVFALSDGEKSVKSSRRWMAATRVLLWGAVGFAFAAVYLLTFSISAMEVIMPKSSTGPAVTRGTLLQFLQWVVFASTALYVITVHYRLHGIVKQVWDNSILPLSNPPKSPTTETPPPTEPKDGPVTDAKDGPATTQESSAAPNYQPPTVLAELLNAFLAPSKH